LFVLSFGESQAAEKPEKAAGKKPAKKTFSDSSVGGLIFISSAGDLSVGGF
jgi:hypothetical protein